MAKNIYKAGDCNIICDVCAKKFKASEAKERWDGFIVCPDDYEMRHEQDFVQARLDKITVPYSRPKPPDIFTDVVYICTADGRTAIAGLATAGCSITGTTR